MRILVTGGAGFIGSHIAEHLIALGHEVAVMDDLSGGDDNNVPLGYFAWVWGSAGSITRPASVEKVFENFRPEIVFHCAAYAAEGLSHWIRNHNYSVNVLGSMNIVNACVKHRVKHLVFLSSIAVYGSIPAPFKETDTPRPEDPYGIAKYAVELDLEAAHRQFGLEYTIFRPHNVFGPRQNINDAHRNAVAIFIRQALTGQPITIFGDGMQRRDFTYVKDIVPGICSAPFIERQYRVYNCGSADLGEPFSWTVRELAGKINDYCGNRSSFVHLPGRNEVRNATADHSRFQKVFRPKRERFLTAIQTTIDYVKARGITGQPKKFEALELTQGLPEVWR